MNNTKLYIAIFSCLVALLFSSCNKFNSNTNTPVTLRSTKEIGELISAEFHGEVYNSYQNIIVEQTINKMEGLYDKVRYVYDTICENGDCTEYTNAPQKLFDVAPIKAIKKDIENMANTLGVKNSNAMLSRIIADSTWQLLISKDYDYKRQRNRKSIEEYMEKKITDNLDKKNIAYIARGSVKAGFDLQNYNFDMYKKQMGDTLILTNLEPIILNADINPWYLPEKKIKGFEMVNVEKGKRLTFDEIIDVKKYCRQLLLKEAFDLQILESAAESGQEHLQAFYTLMNINNINPINVLILKPPFLFEEKAEWLQDAMISKEEMQSILAYENQILADSLFGFKHSAQIKAYWDYSLQQIQSCTVPGQNYFLWDEFYEEKFQF